MKGVEEIGLIKFDFLALKNLTLIAEHPRPDRAPAARSRRI